MIPLVDLVQAWPLAGAGGGVAVAAGALALGLRHGIDWDHIAAITDITSSAAVAPPADERWLTSEPGVQLTDESHHRLSSEAREVSAPIAGGAVAPAHAHEHVGTHGRPGGAAADLWRRQRRPLLLGTLYALGHGAVVVILGLIALLASSFLPDWIDPIMGRVVGVTLLLLAAYLYYSVYRYFRGGEFHLRSRWMLVFVVARHGWGWLTATVRRRPYHRVAHEPQQYGPRAAFGIGAIHGIGAETGTQVLLIAAAAGATSTATGVAALMAFVVGLLISNSFVTITTTAGFVSARRRQWVYVVVGILAATFSLVIGIAFLLAWESVLPDLDPYLRWIGGPR